MVTGENPSSAVQEWPQLASVVSQYNLNVSPRDATHVSCGASWLRKNCWGSVTEASRSLERIVDRIL